MSHDPGHGHDAGHDSHDSPELIRKHLKVYKGIFGALMVLTVLTVAVGALHVPIALGVLIALIIASLKASLVAGFFMHLIGEKKLIWATLILTAFMFVVLMAVPILTVGEMSPHDSAPPAHDVHSEGHAGDGEHSEAAESH